MTNAKEVATIRRHLEDEAVLLHVDRVVDRRAVAEQQREERHRHPERVDLCGAAALISQSVLLGRYSTYIKSVHVGY